MVWYLNNITIRQLINILSKHPYDSEVKVGTYGGVAKLIVDNEIVILSEDGSLEFTNEEVINSD